MREVKFEEIIKEINNLDYLEESKVKFEFAVVNNTGAIQGRAIINKKGFLVVYADGKQVWYIDPDVMELYDTIRRISIYFNCTDNSKYYIYEYI